MSRRGVPHAHIAQAVSLRGLREDIRKVEGVNAKIAVALTSAVGTMACAYLFAIIALLGLPAALRPGGEGLVAWVAQTFLQLVLLSVIMVGQSVQSAAADQRATLTEQNTERLLDLLDVHTEGGLHEIAARLDNLKGLS